MEVFNTTEPTPLQRKRAKAVNFGIVYGISSFGLANDLGITRKEADEYINKYFDIYPEIKDFMKNTIENCEKDNYVQTLFNRRRYIPDITSPVYTVREYAKRTAMNAPIQGTAADIIKIAMVKIADKMEKLKLKSKILLQVHDELIFEVFDNELEMFKNLIKKEMEEAVKLNVPLTVSLDIGTNWFEI
jgi:DNA polymerase-1